MHHASNTNNLWMQIEAKLDAIVLVSQNLLLKMESSHPLVPKRKLTASQLQRGAIYMKPDFSPHSVAAAIMLRHTQDRELGDSAPQQQLLQLPNSPLASSEGARKKADAEIAIRIDPKLASMFQSEPSFATGGKDAAMH